MKLQGFKDELSERIISETEVLRIISLEPNPRNRAILLTFYAGGFRVSEICAMKWQHLQERDSTGQITIFAKGDKTRSVLMPKSVWETLISLRGEAPLDAPVFRSRKKGHLVRIGGVEIVKKATKRAGNTKGCFVSLVSSCTCKSCIRSWRSDSLSPSDVRPFINCDNWKISCTLRPSDSSGNYLPLG